MYAKHIPTTEKVDFPYQKPQQASGSLDFEPRTGKQAVLTGEVLKEIEAFAKRIPEKENA